jgi:hypothetical protein
MKKIFTPNYGRKYIVILSLILFSFFLRAQPDYKFRNPVLVSGTNLAAGAKYKFANVKIGVDAYVTVKSFFGSVSLSEIDATSTGFDEAFQPFISSPAHTDGYVEFEIKFVTAGTNTAMLQTEVAATSIDIDGNDAGTLFEHDQFNLNGGQLDYNMMGAELSITDNGGGWFSGINISGIGYPGVDTTAKQVMFTVFNSNISSFTARIGVNNASNNSEVRYRSVYFKKFVYPNSLLPVHLISFQGNLNKNNKVTLNWTAATNETVDHFEVERSVNGKDFTTVAMVFATEKYGTEDYMYYGTTNSNDKVMYRLKMFDKGQDIDYSKILVFQSKTSNTNKIKIYNNPVNDKLTFSYTSMETQTVSVKVYDLTGKVLMSQKVNSLVGSNMMSLPLNATFKPGIFVVEVTNGVDRQITKFVKQ